MGAVLRQQPRGTRPHHTPRARATRANAPRHRALRHTRHLTTSPPRPNTPPHPSPRPYPQPWQHYVPLLDYTTDDLLGKVAWLDQNPRMAARIARAGREFACAHMTEHARSCYYRAATHQYNRREAPHGRGSPLAAPPRGGRLKRYCAPLLKTPALSALHVSSRPDILPSAYLSGHHRRFILAYDVDAALLAERRAQFPDGMYPVTRETLACAEVNSPRNGCQWRGPRYKPPFDPFGDVMD